MKCKQPHANISTSITVSYLRFFHMRWLYQLNSIQSDEENDPHLKIKKSDNRKKRQIGRFSLILKAISHFQQKKTRTEDFSSFSSMECSLRIGWLFFSMNKFIEIEALKKFNSSFIQFSYTTQRTTSLHFCLIRAVRGDSVLKFQMVSPLRFDLISKGKTYLWHRELIEEVFIKSNRIWLSFERNISNCARKLATSEQFPEYRQKYDNILTAIALLNCCHIHGCALLTWK